MELLHVYGPDGAEVCTEDLSGHEKSVKVCRVNGKLELSEQVAAGGEVVAALIRNEDGWVLASASPDVPVVAGPKSAPDMQLMSGLVCSIAGHAFQLERDKAAMGSVLLWRYGGSKVVSDTVLAGRNIVAESASDGKPCVNPPLAGETLFEFFPAADSLDVVTGSGEKRQRLAVGTKTLFAVGGFEGMYLSATDAEAAMKTSAPFAWPSRKPRQALLLGLLVLAGLGAVCAVLWQRLGQLNRRLAEPRGAVKAEMIFDHSPYDDKFETKAVYDQHFFRSLPHILGPEPSPIAQELVRLGEAAVFTNDVAVARRVKFLRDVQEIQTLILAGRWDALKAQLDQVDRQMFTIGDAEDFLRDAEDARALISETQPVRVRDYLNSAEVIPESKIEEVKAKQIARVKDNRFLAGRTYERELRQRNERMEACVAYRSVRDAAEKAGNGATPQQILSLTDVFCSLRDQLDAEGFPPILQNEAKRIARFATGVADSVLSRSKEDLGGFQLAKLRPLSDLGTQAGMPEAVVGKWIAQAKAAHKMLDLRYQELYRLYRTKGLSDAKLALDTLKEMIDIGFVESPYYKWALREQERRNKK